VSERCPSDPAVSSAERIIADANAEYDRAYRAYLLEHGAAS
jgi:hypothetical protein